MNELSAARFTDFFREVYGDDPFPWQARLAQQVVDARPGEPCWPDVLALPTAAGKTACIDIAVFALACQARRAPEGRTAPRRIFFVVDRRIIVDATRERALMLARALANAEGGIVKDVADRLRFLASGSEPDADHGTEPLSVFRMRGGMYRDDQWFRSPLQPTVVVSTVDQFGSRLLFRGYGPSNYMWPVHAGLAANDSLVILDEAHCANPFRQTLGRVMQYRQWHTAPNAILNAPFALMLASATPPADAGITLTVNDDDRNHCVLGPRLRSAKPARLVPVRGLNGDDAGTRWASRIAEEAVGLAGDGRTAIGVIVNRVATAKAVHEQLEHLGHQSVLLTGRMRPLDRDRVTAGMEVLRTGRPRESLGSMFVVATQTLEVGADLDFDGLVTECAGLDALRQRFGRLDRAGRAITARAVVVAQAAQIGRRSRPDPIYGDALGATWQWLVEHATAGEIDFGHEAFERILPADAEERGSLLRTLSAPGPDAPVLFPAHLDAWAQTSPTPTPDPDISIFLHGPDRGDPDVQVCWRADLPVDIREPPDVDRAARTVSLCPPATAECLAVPLSAFRRWLRGDDRAEPISDIEGAHDDTDTARERPQGARVVLQWRGPDDSAVLGSQDAAELRPGDTLVVPAELGGWDLFGHIPEATAATVDIGDAAHFESRSVPVLRVHERTLEVWPACPERDALQDMARRDDMPEAEELSPLLAAIAGRDDAPDWLKASATAFARGRRRTILSHPGGGLVLRGDRVRAASGSGAGTLTDEDDAYSATVEVLLDAHLEGVAAWALHFGRGAGLPETLVQDLGLAARLHDQGKADPRQQTIFHGGNPWAAASGVLLAKSAHYPASRSEYHRACRASGFPIGGRHELLSAALAESAPDLLASAHDPDLVLHLVASHHGRCRPFAPVVRDPDPVHVETVSGEHAMAANSDTGLERLDSGVPERFWLLVRRYGWWGLAWLEALLRVADHRCSEHEQLAQHESPLNTTGSGALLHA